MSIAGFKTSTLPLVQRELAVATAMKQQPRP
jgi:hypothetical protein